jgi:uncharacterized protein
MLFVDTSCLVKLYHSEVGSATLFQFLRKRRLPLVISFVTPLEYHSALAKRVRVGDLTTTDFNLLTRRFNTAQGTFLQTPFSDALLTKAIALIAKHSTQLSLKTLYALQLASALQFSGQTVFVSADQALCNIAALEGLPTFNPLMVTP